MLCRFAFKNALKNAVGTQKPVGGGARCIKNFASRNNLNFKFSPAFTLSELLMSVLVISIIMVAMAPVITKRVSDNISVADVKYEGRLFEYNTPGLGKSTL